MSDEERYRTALIVLMNNLLPPGGFDFRPMSSEMAYSLAMYAKDVLEGMTPEEAGKRQTENSL